MGIENNAKLNMRPGLKCNLNQSRPKFNAVSSLSSSPTKSTSSLKQAASASISNAQNVSVFSSGIRQSGSAFVPAARLVSANNYRFDRTSVTPWGSVQGDHYPIGQTGVTHRSYDRYMQQMGYSKYNINPSDDSSGSFWKALGFGLLGATAIGAGVVAVKAHKDGVSFKSELKQLFGSGDVNTNQKSVSSQLDDSSVSLQASINENSEKLENDNTELTKLSNAEVDYKQAQENLESLTKQESDLNSKIGELQTSIDGLTKNLEGIEYSISKLSSDDPNLATLQAQKEKVESQLNQIKENLETKQGELTSVQTQKQEASNELPPLKAQVEQKSKLEKEVKQLEKQIEHDKSSITKLVTKEEKHIEKLATKLEKLQTKITNEKDETKKTKLQDDYNSLVSEYNTACSTTTSDKYEGTSYSPPSA